MSIQNTYVPANEGGVLTYPTFVSRLFKREGFPPLMHAAVGISGEAGELIDAIKKHIVYEKPLDVENVKEELGDLIFYMQAMMNELNLTWDEVIQANAKKLNKRYSSGTYSNEQAQARADKKEEIKYYVFLSHAKREAKQYIAFFDDEEHARLMVLSFKNTEVHPIFNPQGYCYPEACWEAVSADGFAEYMQE